MKISKLSRILVVLATAALIVSLFVPIWRIYLDAPQYPEGLSLQIWANGILGDVDIINGLNHYIGMKTLHSKDFIEFTVLPYIIVAFALLFAITAVTGKRKLLHICFWAFVVFGIVAMIDFWKWEYDYGHNLDPNAAIKVPGMAYQPPLIGFKQLLNFGAFSVPDIGGWLFVSAGILLLIAILKETGSLSKFKKRKRPAALFAVALLLLSSCNNNEPEPVLLNKDACAHCKMTIAEANFAAEAITKKGRVYKFDDVLCMLHYVAENNAADIAGYYIGNEGDANHHFINAATAWYVHADAIKSPMGGNTAAFADKSAAEKLAAQHQAGVQNWDELKSTLLPAGKHEQHH